MLNHKQRPGYVCNVTCSDLQLDANVARNMDALEFQKLVGRRMSCMH